MIVYYEDLNYEEFVEELEIVVCIYMFIENGNSYNSFCDEIKEFFLIFCDIM